MLSKLIMVLLSISLFAGCSTKDTKAENTQLKQEVTKLKTMMQKMRASDDKLMFLSSKENGVKARIKTNMGNIEVKFFPEQAPLQCFNFITRAESGFYNGTLFHRVIKGFMIQGGDPNTKGSDVASYGQGGPIVMIPHEFNNISHKRGILSTARVSNQAAGAGSQFFIMHQDMPSLDHQYTAFGEVTKGMDVVDKIAATRVTKQDRPLVPVRIKTIDVYR